MPTINDGNGSTYDLDRMSTDELLELKSAFDNRAAKIRFQLDNARASYHTTGVPANTDWYNRAKLALRLTGRDSQTIQRVLGRRKRERKTEWEELFAEEAKIHLQPETYEYIVSRVEERL